MRGNDPGPDSGSPAMDPMILKLNNDDPTVAVIGATDSERKFGSKIYRDLKRKGVRLFPVNPTRETVHGDRSYPDLASLPEPPGIVNFVVPPRRTLRILEEAQRLGYTSVWIQPGAADEAVVRYLDRHDFDYVVDDCIMVRSIPRRSQ